MELTTERYPPFQLTPHERLPPELMTRIFAHVTEQQLTSYTRPTSGWRRHKAAFQLQGYLVNLRLVCRVWKEIIEAAPELHPLYIMKIAPSKRLEELFPGIVTSASDWFSRSGALKCELRIHVLGAYKFGGTTSLMRPLFHVIAPRLRVLFYNGPFKQLIPFLEAYNPRHSLDLEELNLQAGGDTFIRGDDEGTYSFLSNQHLTSLTLAEHAVSLVAVLDRFRLKIPWSQLRKLSLALCYQLTADKARFLFLQCPNLVDCEMLYVGGWGAHHNRSMRSGFSFDDNPLGAGHNTFVHNHLRRLEIECSKDDVTPFFWTLRLPALQSLIVGHSNIDFVCDLPTSLWEMYQRAPFPLTQLRLVRCRTPVGPLIGLLTALSETLTHLELDDCSCFTRTFVTSMTLLTDPSQAGPDSTRKSIVPRLAKFVLTQDKISMPKQMLVDFVQSRVYDDDSVAAQHFGPAALKFVRFGTNVQRYMEPELIDLWREKGCDFKFRKPKT